MRIYYDYISNDFCLIVNNNLLLEVVKLKCLVRSILGFDVSYNEVFYAYMKAKRENSIFDILLEFIRYLN